MVKSLNYHRENIERNLKLLTDWWGYNFVHLVKDKKYKMRKIHRLVAQAFLWLNIEDKKIMVCHKDDNPINNRADNLFLWTHQDNIDDKMMKWRYKKWVKYKSVVQLSKDWIVIKIWEWIIKIQQEIWISATNISSCCRWKLKSAWWYRWKYFNK